MSGLSAYVVGRPHAPFGAPYLAKDTTFAAERHDNATVESSKYEHCTFINIGFKEATLKNGEFLDCIFIGCYFRRANFIHCNFVGCRFFDCNFSHISLKSCNFRFSSFHDCQINHSEMEYCLPQEPNLREDLARNLSVESSRLGLSHEARKYRISEIRAREEHLRSAIVGKSQWYREHFDNLGRLQAFAKLTLSLFNRWLWGYGEQAFVLIRNLFLLSFLIFPFLFYIFGDQLAHKSGRPIALWDHLYFSLENVIPAGIVSDIVATGATAQFLAALESLFGVVAIALFAAYIFRWSLHR